MIASNTCLHDADLRGAEFNGEVLRRVDLSGADLTGALLQPTFVEQVTFSEDTIWPDGTKHPVAGELNGPQFENKPGWHGDLYSRTAELPVVVHNLFPGEEQLWAAIENNCGSGCCGIDAYNLRPSAIRWNLGLLPEWAGPVADRIRLADDGVPPDQIPLEQLAASIRAAAAKVAATNATHVQWRRFGIALTPHSLADLLRHLADAASPRQIDNYLRVEFDDLFAVIRPDGSGYLQSMQSTVLRFEDGVIDYHAVSAATDANPDTESGVPATIVRNAKRHRYFLSEQAASALYADIVEPLATAPRRNWRATPAF